MAPSTPAIPSTFPFVTLKSLFILFFPFAGLPGSYYASVARPCRSITVILGQSGHHSYQFPPFVISRPSWLMKRLLALGPPGFLVPRLEGIILYSCLSFLAEFYRLEMQQEESVVSVLMARLVGSVA